MSQTSMQQTRVGRDQEIRRRYLTDPESYSSVLLRLVLDLYPPTPGEEPGGALAWSPATIREELEQDFAIQLSPLILDRIIKALTVLTTNYFYKDTQAFIDICNTFAGSPGGTGDFDPADTAEILWGLLESSLIYPPTDDPDDTEFSSQILEYMRQAFIAEGVTRLPPPFRLESLLRSPDELVATATDPMLYSALWSRQDGTVSRLRRMLYENLTELRQQFLGLPLSTGTNQTVLGVIDAVLQQTAGASDEPSTR